MRRRRFIAALCGAVVAGIVLGSIAASDDTADEEARSDAEESVGVFDDTTTTEALSPSTTEPPATTTTEATTTTSTTEPEPEGFSDGVWVVGEDIEPGIYRTQGPGDGEWDLCYWARLSGLTGDFEELIVNGIPEGPASVEILPTDVAFETSGCGEWVR
jgi:hypothetical protein